MIFRRETFGSITAACAGLEAWTAGVPELGSLLAMVNYTDTDQVHTTLASRDHWRAHIRANRKLDLSVLAAALELADSADVLRVVMFDATHGGSMPLAELRELLDEEEQNGR